MTRGDAPGVALATVVGAGLLWNLLGPNVLGGIVVVSGGLVGACVWAVAITVGVVGVPAWWWGAVRVTRPRMRWALAGPTDRGPALGRSLRRTLGVVVACGAAAGFAVGALTRSSTPFVDVGTETASGAVAAALVVAIACAAQMRRSARASTTARAVHPIARWHRDVVAPADGLAATSRLLLLTADTEFVDHARRVRWCAGRSAAPRRSVAAASPVATMLRADVVRLRRRPGDLGVWTAVVAVTIAVGLTTTMHSVAPAIAALLAYRAGSAVASGLRTLTTTPALRRALRATATQILLAHGAIPAVAVVGWACVAITTIGGVTPVGWCLIVIGAIAATARRATRPETPWDAPVYITGQGGVAQPLLLLALLRGHIATAVVAALACVV